jgi:phosphoglycerol transferase MdoB-like AlkP superfamily enzyme
MSKIPYKPESAMLRKEKSLAKLLKDQKGFTSIFIRGVSKFYSNEHLIIRNLFGFDHLIAYEDLAKLYPKPDFFDWGYHDDVVFAEGLRLLKEQRKEKTFMVIKLIDQHQPPHYCGIPDEELPEIVRKHPSKIIKMLYWANHCLENFYRNLEKENLLNDKTLLIITSDHYAFPGFGHQKLIKEKFDPLGRLPLIFVTPGNKLPLQTEKTFSQLDLTHAICDILDIAPSHYFIGQSMFSENSVSRRLGIFEDKIILKNKDLKLELDCANKIFPNSACEKWFINLFADH